MVMWMVPLAFLKTLPVVTEGVLLKTGRQRKSEPLRRADREKIEHREWRALCTGIATLVGVHVSPDGEVHAVLVEERLEFALEGTAVGRLVGRVHRT
jgi:hypothetical protein